MAEPYIGQIEIFGFGFPPRGWATCSGQTLQISQNQALFALLGTTYGGNGVTTFMLPDLRGRIPLGYASAFPLGAHAGEEQYALVASQMPQHTHSLNADAATTTGIVAIPAPNVTFGQSSGKQPSGVFAVSMYGGAPDAALDARTLATVGGLPHENRKPYLALNFCIALTGVFPPRS